MTVAAAAPLTGGEGPSRRPLKCSPFHHGRTAWPSPPEHARLWTTARCLWIVTVARGCCAKLPGMPPRFLQLADVAEILNVSSAAVYALVRSGELPAIKVGARGAWRVEAEQLEAYIQRMYTQTREFVSTHPFGGAGSDEEPTD